MYNRIMDRVGRNDIRDGGVVRRNVEEDKGKGGNEGQESWNAVGRNIKKGEGKGWEVGLLAEHGREGCREEQGKR